MPDGTTRLYDPFAIIRGLAPVLEAGAEKTSYTQLQDVARKCFDLGPEITDYQVMFLINQLVRFVEESAAVKGLMPVPQS